MLDAPVQTLTLDEFIRQYEVAPFELIDGERILIMPTVSIHGKLSKRLFTALLPYEADGIGEAFYEQPFVLVYDSNWVKGSRVPDVMFFLVERLTAYRNATPDYDSKPFILVPDLAVEIVSENDSYSEIDLKVERYLQDGVQLIWVVDPKSKTVIVHQSHSQQQTRLKVGDTLTGGDLLPNFALGLEKLFAV